MENQVWYTNGKLFINGRFHQGSFCVKDGKFGKIITVENEPNGISESLIKTADEVIDLQGNYVIPGLVDIHIHGAAGFDFSDGDAKGLVKMAEFLASRGVTSFLPTAMTLPEDGYAKAAVSLTEADLSGKEVLTARVLGMRMEGPFLSREKCGAQNPEFLQSPDPEMIGRIQALCGGQVRILDLAPELPGALDFIKAEKEIVISLAHTNAVYAEAVNAFKTGASHVTHLYNGMRPFHHREPGLIGAAWDSKDATAELIGDGYHVHEAAVRTAFRMMPHRICLVSDALRCLGMPEGEYELSGQIIRCTDGVARLSDGTLAGSCRDLFEDLKTVISFGIPAEDAIEAATEIPARVVGNPMIGSIEEGKFADFIICDENFNRKDVLMGGHR